MYVKLPSLHSLLQHPLPSKLFPCEISLRLNNRNFNNSKFDDEILARMTKVYGIRARGSKKEKA